ncbi:MAG TPA: pantetheine-phosphate adenylyltransferase [Myxococcota bacterium]|nr:pantetheine-phosphate adenylyltransferase [Myxococcota bacterium]HNZ02666.1 pantetheine-phosphate adenylyltransferase [Myxococcota bacterium]HOD06693.1 pantetheine-phosphate adenylyltransferase [Myxococcota bacterium]HPB50045.1 pantetheine-phosphate adenylyltransferase [Myxococcota bacterium]HQP94583.1 pantetheine-phosphate adenylyltransferase [Myxococcota bacterium]
MATVVYPGSFDPVTCGHVSLVRRAASVFGNVIVAVATNSRKSELFTSDERVEMLRMATAGIPGVEVDSFSGLLVDYMRRRQVRISIRGLRAVSDFEYEFQMAHMNGRLDPGMETVFMVAGPAETYISSSLVREVAMLGGDITGMVHPEVGRMLSERLRLL